MTFWQIAAILGWLLAMWAHVRADFWRQSFERAQEDYKALLSAYNNIPRTRKG